MQNKVGLKIVRNLDVFLRVNKREQDHRRNAVELVVSVPVFYDENNDVVIARLGTDGNFAIDIDNIKKAGLELTDWK